MTSVKMTWVKIDINKRKALNGKYAQIINHKIVKIQNNIPRPIEKKAYNQCSGKSNFVQCMKKVLK